MEAKRVLILGMTSNQGGLESYILNIFKNIDRSKLVFDFVNVHDEPLAYEEEYKKLGGNVYRIHLKSEDLQQHKKDLEELFSKNHYVGMYYQCNHKLVSLDFFKYAKKYGVEKRVMHSHNSQENPHSFIHEMRERLVQFLMPRYVTDYFACSKNAGEWMFPGKSFTVIPNSIHTNLFDYREEIRNDIRKQLKIEDKIVFGTVGRASVQKNPMKIIDIFKEIHNENPNTVFIHAGDGELLEDMKKKIQEEGLEDSYHLLGRRTDISALMHGMDCMLLPSLHEGFPIVLVEAQCTGLPCLVADNITRECQITDLVQYKNIEDSSQSWSQEALKMVGGKRESKKDILVEKGYDIQTMSRNIQAYFIGE